MTAFIVLIGCLAVGAHAATALSYLAEPTPWRPGIAAGSPVPLGSLRSPAPMPGLGTELMSGTQSASRPRSVLSAGESLLTGRVLTSPNGRFRLVLRPDGNIVLQDRAGSAALAALVGSFRVLDVGLAAAAIPATLWDSRTAGSGGSALMMRSDGNLVLYRLSDSVAEPVWQTRTAGWAGAALSVGDDGAVVVRRPDGRVLWTAGASTPDAGIDGAKHVVYARGAQRVWLIDADGSLYDTYLVSGRATSPVPGRYRVFSKSMLTYSLSGGATMEHMVRFARGPNGNAIGFHSIPRGGSGRPIQSVHELGQHRSAGCVRQHDDKAQLLYEWAPVGTPVVVLE